MYGGTLRNRRRGRRGPRPLATKQSMHLCLKSSRATGEWSFYRHRTKVRAIVDKFTRKYRVSLHSMANVGNHLHLHIQLRDRHAYKPFIRAISAAIAMAVTGASRWNKVKTKFWDYRPFTRVIVGFNAFLRMKDYIFINQVEGQGYDRPLARIIVNELIKRRSRA